jgi:hypothetical protein
VIEALALAVACGRIGSQVSLRPPAPIVARTGCGTFLIRRDGSVSSYRVRAAPPWAPQAVSHPAPNTWVAHPRGHLAVYRNGRLLWQSRLAHGTDDVAVDENTIAFSVEGPRTPESLWIAHVGQREREIRWDEEPVAWTAGGLVTQAGDEIRVRAPSGKLIRIVDRGHGPVYDAADRTVLFISRSGVLERTDGTRVWRLARGFRSSSWVSLLDNRVLDVSTGRRSVFLRTNGARLRVAVPLDEPSAVMGGVVALPNARGIVYVVNRARNGSSPGVNAVYVARPGLRRRLLFVRRVPRLSCGETAGLSYGAGRILYVDEQGPMAFLDPNGRARPVDVTAALRVLQPRQATRAQLTADWLWKWR